MRTRLCQRCGERFPIMRAGSSVRYCSDECRARPRTPKQCPTCGVEFTADRAYCGPACEQRQRSAFAMPIEMDVSWHAQARCRTEDPEIFFPERGQPTEPARKICAECPVASECLEYALAVGEKIGIFGGKSERERRAIRRQRRMGREVA